MILANVKSIQIPEGNVKRISKNGNILWKADEGGEILPSAYKRVEYIESTGTQWIDTGIIPNETTEFELMVYSNNEFNTSSGFRNIFGSNNSSNGNMLSYQLSTYGTYSASTGGGQFQNNKTKVSGLGMSKQTIMIISYHNKVFYGGNNITKNVNAAAYTGATSIYLFSNHPSNGATPKGGNHRIYYFKLYNQGSVVRDFIPCYRKRDDEIGLYDLVEGVFYTNKGTGLFTKGADV